jgi:hypothetical protein
MRRTLCCALLALLAATSTIADSDSSAAPTTKTTTQTTLNRVSAPRGWNSYNGWGAAVNESVLLAVADYVQARRARFSKGLFSRARARLAPRVR